jgi:hypothetical protein
MYNFSRNLITTWWFNSGRCLLLYQFTRRAIKLTVVIGLLYASADLPPRTEPQDTLDRMLGGLQNWSRTRWIKKFLVPVQISSNRRSMNNRKMVKCYETKKCLKENVIGWNVDIRFMRAEFRSYECCPNLVAAYGCYMSRSGKKKKVCLFSCVPCNEQSGTLQKLRAQCGQEMLKDLWRSLPFVYILLV